jgi:DNA-binding response OmpR family regulator
MKVLLLDDDEKLVKLTADYLKKNKVSACIALNAQEFERLLH